MAHPDDLDELFGLAVEISRGKVTTKELTRSEKEQRYDEVAAAARRQELDYEKNIEARERWLDSQLAYKTPAQAYTFVLNALQDAKNVADMRGVLEQILPILAASVALLTYSIENDIEPPGHPE